MNGPIVVDLGCADRGEWFSLDALIDWCAPTFVYGFDPSPLWDASRTEIKGVPCHLERKAAWLYDGEIGFYDGFTPGHTADQIGVGPPGQLHGRIGYIHRESGGEIPCFDFAEWLLTMPQPVIVKMDIEGAEYDLLDHIIKTGANAKIAHLVMEWHDVASMDRVIQVGCPYTEWWM